MLNKTLHLEWKNMGSLWAAKDILCPTKKWIVERTDGRLRFRAFWYQDGIPTSVAEADIPEHLQWECVIRSLSHLNNIAHFDKNQIANKALSILQDLTNGTSTSVEMDYSI